MGRHDECDAPPPGTGFTLDEIQATNGGGQLWSLWQAEGPEVYQLFSHGAVGDAPESGLDQYAADHGLNIGHFSHWPGDGNQICEHTYPIASGDQVGGYDDLEG